MITLVVLDDIYEYRYDIDLDIGHELVILIANRGDYLDIIYG